MRLIDANALAEQFKNLAEKWRSSFSGVAYQNAYERIKDAPTVDAAPVVHGRCRKSEMRDEWYTFIYTCLKCGAEMMVSDEEGRDIAPNLCPKCGAKFDLKE